MIGYAAESPRLISNQGDVMVCCRLTLVVDRVCMDMTMIMATLAVSNVAGILMGYPALNQPDILPFLKGDSLKPAPSILNAKKLNTTLYEWGEQ